MAEEDIAISSVADMVRSSRAAAATSSNPTPESVTERFESMHQKVASAAAAPIRGTPSAQLTESLRRAGMWAAAGCVVVVALAVWLRPEVLVDEEAAAASAKAGEPVPLSWWRVAAAGAAAGAMVGALDLVSGMRG